MRGTAAMLRVLGKDKDASKKVEGSLFIYKAYK